MRGDEVLLAVTLPDSEQMSDALIRVSPDWGHRARLYPKLLVHAGETLTARELSRVFVAEVADYTQGTSDLTGLVAKWIFRLVSDETVAATALGEYVRFALYADDAITQEFVDYTATRLLEKPIDEK